MDKEKILQMSRKENEGQQDEWEQSIEFKSARLSKAVGLTVCVLLALFCDFLLLNRLISLVGWIVFFAMEGSSNLYLYWHNKKSSKLIWGILEIVCAVVDVILLVLFAMR